jgi:hypothetical protein
VLILKQLLPGDDCRMVDAAGLLRGPNRNDNAAMDAEPKRKRHWYQFSLRTLLIFTLVLAIACAFLARRVGLKRRERQAVEAIVKAGGQVQFDYQRGKFVGGNFPAISPPGPAWLRSALGDNFFSDVFAITYQKIPDAEPLLANVGMFPQLESLNISFSSIDDAALDRLTSLSELKSLWLVDTKIDDSGLQHLKRFTNLTYLNVTGTKVTRDGVQHFRDAMRTCEVYW